MPSPLDSVTCESDGGFMGLPGTNTYTVKGFKGGQQVVVISENCGAGGNRTKYERFCDYAANKGYYLTKGQVNQLAGALNFSATDAFNIAKTITGVVPH
mmetsp:Transcript_43792/g.91692  ORF Transcript_43792/g.91692 Transcript_43792/m.91692 type:complete len:99 (+) Transcript_43792:2-298(+)